MTETILRGMRFILGFWMTWCLLIWFMRNNGLGMLVWPRTELDVPEGIE